MAYLHQGQYELRVQLYNNSDIFTVHFNSMFTFILLKTNVLVKFNVKAWCYHTRGSGYVDDSRYQAWFGSVYVRGDNLSKHIWFSMLLMLIFTARGKSSVPPAVTYDRVQVSCGIM